MAVSTDNKYSGSGAGSATLASLAQSRRTTGAAPASLQNSAGVTPAFTQQDKVVDKTPELIGDIGKMFGETVEEHQVASTYAGEYTGVDNMTEFRKEMATLNAQYAEKKGLTSAEMFNKDAQEKLIYDKYMEKGVFQGNDLANEGFKKTYGRPATEHLFKQRTLNAGVRQDLFAKETKIDVRSKMGVQGVGVNVDTVGIFKKQYSDARLDPALVYDVYADVAIANIKQAYHDNNKLFVSAGESGTVFNETMGGQLLRMSSNSEGDNYISVLDENMDERAVSKIRDAWNAIVQVDKTANQAKIKGNPTPELVKPLKDTKKISNNLIDSTESILIGNYAIKTKNNATYPTSGEGFTDRQEIARMGPTRDALDALETSFVAYNHSMAVGSDQDSFTSFVMMNDKIYTTMYTDTGSRTLSQATYTVTPDNAISYIQGRVNNEDAYLATLSYGESTKNGNRMVSLANMQLSSGGKIKSKYMVELDGALSDGKISGGSFSEVTSNINKALDYRTAMGTVSEAWYGNPQARDNLHAMVASLKSQMGENNEGQVRLTDSEAAYKLKNYVYGQKAISQMKSITSSIDGDKILKEAFEEFTGDTKEAADALAEVGILRANIGDERLVPMGLSMFLKKVKNDTLHGARRGELKDLVTTHFTVMGTTGPTLENVVFYNGGQNVNQVRANAAIYDRIKKDNPEFSLPDSVASSDNITFTNAPSSKNGETVLVVAFRPTKDSKSNKNYVFTMAELDRGKVLYNKVDKPAPAVVSEDQALQLERADDNRTKVDSHIAQMKEYRLNEKGDLAGANTEFANMEKYHKENPDSAINYGADKHVAGEKGSAYASNMGKINTYNAKYMGKIYDGKMNLGYDAVLGRVQYATVIDHIPDGATNILSAMEALNDENASGRFFSKNEVLYFTNSED